jgi:hypothetical protein
MKWLRLKGEHGPVLMPVDVILYIKSLPEEQGTRVMLKPPSTVPVDVVTTIPEIEQMLTTKQKKPEKAGTRKP